MRVLVVIALAAVAARAQYMTAGGVVPPFVPVPVPAVHTVTVVPPFLAKPAPLPSCSALGDQTRASCNYCKSFLEKGTAGACDSVKDQIASIEARLAAGAGATDSGTGDTERALKNTMQRISEQYLTPCQNVRDDVVANAGALRSWVQRLHPHFDKYSFGVACADVGCCEQGVEVAPFRTCSRQDRDLLASSGFCGVCQKLVAHRLLSLQGNARRVQRRKFDCPFVTARFAQRNPAKAARLQSMCLSLDNELLSNERYFYETYLRSKELFRQTVCWQWNPRVFASEPCPQLITDVCRSMECCA